METPHPHAVFWIETAKISTNPFQPRKFFDEARLQDLSDSIRRYGVLQPIVVTRKEEFTPEGGMIASYELIAGERRLRASKMAGLQKIPAIVREDDSSDEEKLELAILENLQREDLNPVDRARSFGRLIDEFGLTHAQVGERLGKSREYVSNSMRLLALPEHMLNALSQGRISEGHTRPLLMLKERTEEQETLFMQLINASGSMTVREAEKFARSIAKEKQRVNKDLDPEMKEIQQKLSSRLGAKVSIDKSAQGGKVTIEFGNKEDLRLLLEKVKREVQLSEEAYRESLQDVVKAAPIASVPQSTQKGATEFSGNVAQELQASSVVMDGDQSQYSLNTTQVRNETEARPVQPDVRTMVSDSEFIPNGVVHSTSASPNIPTSNKVDMVREEWQNPRVKDIQPEIHETFTRSTIDRNIVNPVSTSGEHSVDDLQKEMESFAAQYQSRVSQTTSTSNVEAPITEDKEAIPKELSQFQMGGANDQLNNIGQKQIDEPVFDSRMSQPVTPTYDDVVATQDSSSIREDHPVAEFKTQFIGQDFKPTEPVISSTDRISVGQDFVPNSSSPTSENDNERSDEPFDLSKFSI